MNEFKLPELGENITQGELVKLMISPGSSVTEGQPVMELETDKAVVEVPSSVTGTVKAIQVKQGDKIKVGQVIFTFENAAKASIEPGDSAPKVQRAAANAGGSSARTQSPEQKPASTSQSAVNSAPARRATDTTAPTEFKLPELGENISQGDLVRLMVAPGTKVSEGQPVMELETDKAVIEVPSSVSGTVKEVRVKQGEKIE